MGTAKKATLEDAWAVIRELGELQKETSKELNESHKEMDQQQQETNRQLRHLEKVVEKTSRSIDKVNGNFVNKWGEFVENLVHGDLVDLLGGWNIQVGRIQPRLVYPPCDGRRGGEFDLVAINGDELVVVEVKSTLEKADVHRFIEKLKVFKAAPTEYRGKRIYGGVAYLSVVKKAGEFAEDEGLFVIRAPGGKSQISTIANGPDFKPKAF